MFKKLILISISTFLILLFLYLVNRKIKKPKKSNLGTTLTEKIVIDLDNLNYFKFVPQEFLEEAKNEFKDRFDLEYGVPSYEIDYKLLDDKRIFLDGEENSNVDGFVFDIKKLEPILAKRNIKLSVNKYSDNFDPQTQIRDEKITLNEREYVVYDNKESINGWAESPKMFAEIVNKELKIQGSQEMIYLGSGGNDGYCILLTPEQAEYFDSVFSNKWVKPLKPNEWWITNERRTTIDNTVHHVIHQQTTLTAEYCS